MKDSDLLKTVEDLYVNYREAKLKELSELLGLKDANLDKCAYTVIKRVIHTCPSDAMGGRRNDSYIKILPYITNTHKVDCGCTDLLVLSHADGTKSYECFDRIWHDVDEDSWIPVIVSKVKVYREVYDLLPFYDYLYLAMFYIRDRIPHKYKDECWLVLNNYVREQNWNVIPDYIEYFTYYQVYQHRIDMYRIYGRLVKYHANSRYLYIEGTVYDMKGIFKSNTRLYSVEEFDMEYGKAYVMQDNGALSNYAIYPDLDIMIDESDGSGEPHYIRTLTGIEGKKAMLL